MDDYFEKAFSFTVGVEGGYVVDPKDPGGETKFGISKRAYPLLDIKNLTIDEAKAIYKRDYWDRDHCGEIPWPLGGYLFDDAVNSGAGMAIRQLQNVLGITIDGIVGPQTILMARSVGSELEAEFLAMRIFDETRNPLFQNYGHGWVKRIIMLAMQK